MSGETKVGVVKYPDRANYVLRWTDPETGRQRTKSAETPRRREAEREAAKQEAKIKAGKVDGPPAITWQEFKTAYQEDVLPDLSDATFAIVSTTFSHLEKTLNPKLLKELTPEAVTKWQAALRAMKLAPATVAVHSRHLRAALRWAASQKMIPEAPAIRMPRAAKAQKMKGAPVVLEQYERRERFQIVGGNRRMLASEIDIAKERSKQR